MLRVSSHRRYVVGTFAGQSSEDVSNTYNVTNFKDYGLLQVFYPTRGIPSDACYGLPTSGERFSGSRGSGY
jgi:hypothetical protein